MGGFLAVVGICIKAVSAGGERKRENFDFAPPAASAWGCHAIFRLRWLDAAVVFFG